MDVTVRKLTDADVDAAREVQTQAFAELDRANGRQVPEMTEEIRERQRRRVRHFLANDPDGSWVAETDGAVVGVALALKRDRLWGLSLLVVDPQAQSSGIGRQLLDAALTYADPGAPAVIESSSDPRAMRRYASAGFELHPQIHATGHARADRLPASGSRVRLGGPDDFALADAVDLQVRGAPRAVDHAILAELYPPMLVVDDGAGRGYCYRNATGGAHTLAATDDATASDLLWSCLRYDVEREAESVVPHIAGNQQWAVRIAVEAGLTLKPSGPVFYRGMNPPPAYLPSGPYL